VFKDTNPKDAIATRRGRFWQGVSWAVIKEVSVAMLEGAIKYARHNYRESGVRASVYFDATIGHLTDWWEGEDIDPKSRLSHVTKAIASLFVLRDAMINDMWVDDRPPKSKMQDAELEERVKELFEMYPDPKPPVTAESLAKRLAALKEPK
jgi:Domain of unknown function (DUF5664)